MNIENQIYYHIQSAEPYKNKRLEKGNEYEVSKDERNPYFDFYYQPKYFNPQYFNSTLVRELEYERIRLMYFNDLPSRISCLFVIPPYRDNVLFWWGYLRNTNNKNQLLKLSLTGKIHKANELFLVACETFDIVDENAFKYWTGEKGLDYRRDECLFNGNIKVLDIIDINSILNENLNQPL